jgi:hypothetical protein
MTHVMIDTFYVSYDGGAYPDDAIHEGDCRLQRAFNRFCIEHEIFPLRGTSWGDGFRGCGGGVFEAEHKAQIESFFTKFYLDHPDFPQVPSKS